MYYLLSFILGTIAGALAMAVTSSPKEPSLARDAKGRFTKRS